MNAPSNVREDRAVPNFEASGIDTMTFRSSEQPGEDCYLRMRTQAYADDIGGFLSNTGTQSERYKTASSRQFLLKLQNVF